MKPTEALGHRWRAGLMLILVLTIAGCAPSLSVTPFIQASPTVPDLEAHLTCVLAETVDEHIGPAAAARKTPNEQNTQDYALWENLVKYNFFDTINLTLFVTQSEGLNPSFNFITPLTSFGNSIQKVTESSNGLTNPQNVTTNTNNLTLAVGFQLDGLQDRNFALNYVVDLHALYSAMYAPPDEEHPPILSNCEKDKNSSATGIAYGMKGDLAIAETLENGLQSFQAIQSAPATFGSGGAKQGQQASSAGLAPSAGAASFSSKVDFSLQWGVNGGPSWSILDFKGPGGGSAGGAGGGQLISYGRTKMDTLIMTFAPTCKSDDDVILLQPPATLPVPVPKPDTQPITIVTYHDAYKLRFIIPYQKTMNNEGAISIPGGAVIISDNDGHSYDGYVTWSGFYVATTYSLRGTITDAQSGTTLGYVKLAMFVANKSLWKVDDFKLSQNAFDLLIQQGGAAPTSYWATLPSCVSSGPFLPSGYNVLQQLPLNVSSTLLQQ